MGTSLYFEFLVASSCAVSSTADELLAFVFDSARIEADSNWSCECWGNCALSHFESILVPRPIEISSSLNFMGMGVEDCLRYENKMKKARHLSWNH